MNLNLKRPLSIDTAEIDTPKKKTARIYFTSPDMIKLEEAVVCLVLYKKGDDFPVTCLDAARGTLGELIDAVSGAGDRIGIPQTMASGKNLMFLLVLAIATAKHGIDAVKAERCKFDAARVSERRAPSRSWMSWCKGDRRSSSMLSDIHTVRWSVIKCDLTAPTTTEAEVDDVIDDLDLHIEEEDMDADVARCFASHPRQPPCTADEIMGLGDAYADGWKCDCCDVGDESGLSMHHCLVCLLDMCGKCEGRYRISV